MGKYNTHVDKWISWDNIDELNVELDHLKKEVLTDVTENVLKAKEKKTKKTVEKV